MAFSFSVITAVLLLLYGWTLTETVSVAVEVRDGVCTALLGERSSAIPCPEIAGGDVGVYLTSTSPAQRLWYKPFNLLVPNAAWDSVSIQTADSAGEIVSLFDEREFNPDTAVFWPAPQVDDFVIEARVRRPDGEHAGILLLEPQGGNGWLFKVDSENRQGTWQRWQEERPAEAVAGVPYQKPVLAQAQSLLRQVIATFIGALGVIAVTAAVGWAVNSIQLAVNSEQPTVNNQQSTTSGQRAARNPKSEIPNPKSPHSTLIIALGVFAVSLWLAVDVLERVPHVQDSITFLFQAQTLAEGALWAPQPPQPEAFEQEFLTVWEGKWFGQYPPGYPIILAIGVVAGAPWLVNPWLAVLSAVLLIKLGTLLYKSSTGVLAGGLALLSPFFLFLSGSLMVHAAELFWTLLAMISWALALRSPYRLRWALLAGGALGMLLFTRQITAAAVGVSYMALLLVFEMWAHRERAHLDAPLREMKRQVVAGLIAVLPFVLLLLGYQGALTGSPWRDPRLIGRPFDRPGFGEHIGESENAFKLVSLEDGTTVTWYTDPDQPPRGHTVARGLYNTEKNLVVLAGNLFGWYPLIALAFCWMPFLLQKPNKYDWLLLALLVVMVAVYVPYWTTGIMYGPRYYYAALPTLLLLTARGIQALGRRFGRAATGFVLVAIVVLTLMFYWPAAVDTLHGYNFISGEERMLVEEEIEGRALVFVPVDDWWDYGRFFSGNMPWLDGRIIYARDLGEEENNRLQSVYPNRAAYVWQPITEDLRNLAK